jgi:DNA-binding CsgD family transcriptional regulator
MKRIAVYSGVAIALFLSLAVSEALSNDEPFSVVDFGTDLFEMALLAGAVVFTTYSAQEIREGRIERSELIGKLSIARAEGEKWRSAALVHANGLGSAIKQQFAAWRLTASECDVAILMLKGLSHKEIAQIRNSSAATVRQQAAAVYSKSGLTSRAELAAYFLEDLFPPEGDRGNGSSQSTAETLA